MERKLAETFVEDGEEKKKYPLSSNTQLNRQWRKIKSYIQDTPDLLRKIQEWNSRGPQPPGTVPVSLDITALYPSIPTKKGLVVLRQRLEREGMEVRKVECVIKAMSLILTLNTFSFSGRLHTQASGTSIGSVPAGAYAGVYVERVEETALENWRKRPGKEDSVRTWNRFIDDVFSLYTGSKEEFEEFVRALNEADPDIKFTWESDWERKSVNFLDIVFSINEAGFLVTDLFSKIGMTNQLLLPSSCHPPRTCRNIIFSLALRICSDDEMKEKRLEELKTRLMERKYSKKMVDKELARAREISREEALRRVGENQETQVHRSV